MHLYCSKQIEITFHQFCEKLLHITFKLWPPIFWPLYRASANE